MDQALACINTIHKAVLTSAGEGNPDLMEITRKTAAALGLPPQAVNPLLARTFAANLRAREVPDLLVTRSTRFGEKIR